MNQTKANATKYIAHGGVSCPRCGDGSIEGGSVEIDQGIAWQNVWCTACQLNWTDEYILTSISNVYDDNLPDTEIDIT